MFWWGRGCCSPICVYGTVSWTWVCPAARVVTGLYLKWYLTVVFGELYLSAFLSRTLALFPRVHVRDLWFLHPPLFVLEPWHRISWGWSGSGENADEIQLEYFILVFRMLRLSHVIWHRAGKIRRSKLIAKTTIKKSVGAGTMDAEPPVSSLL